MGLPSYDKPAAINDSGALAIMINFSGQRSYVLSGGGVPLPEFPSGAICQSKAVALNNHGHAVGWATRGASDNPAVLWRDGTLTSLNDLPEVQAAGWWSLTARDINDHDQIVGYGHHDGLVSAFLLSPGTIPSPFSLTITRSGADVVLSFPTEAGFNYDLEYKTQLTATDWRRLTTVSGDGSTRSVSDPLSDTPRFYRGAAH